MNELLVAGQSIKPLTAAQARKRDEMQLRGLTSLINNPEFVEGNSDGDSGKFSPPPSDPMPNETELKRVFTQPAVAAVAVAPPVEKEIVWPANVFTTGRLNAGKDTFLKSIGKTIHGFADPLYAIQRAFFGTQDKTIPGAREFLQKVGQWGRGTITDKYPITAERAVFATLIAAMGGQLGFDVDWSAFGKSDAIWVNALIERTAGLQNIGVSNVRFKNEREALAAAGFTHFHVMASQSTLERRWRENKIAPSATVDISEQMAIGLDKAALAAGSKPGGKLRVIWSDKHAPSPSSRFITL